MEFGEDRLFPYRGTSLVGPFIHVSPPHTFFPGEEQHPKSNPNADPSGMLRISVDRAIGYLHFGPGTPWL